jgi:Holliday junction resolvase
VRLHAAARPRKQLNPTNSSGCRDKSPARAPTRPGWKALKGLMKEHFSSKHAALSNLRRTGGARHRRKGDRIEREIVALHVALGIHAERYPLSGASRFRGSGHDIDIYCYGKDEAPAVAEVKGRKGGNGFVTLERWLADYDALFLRRNNADPLVLLPWRVWAQLLDRARHGGRP